MAGRLIYNRRALRGYGTTMLGHPSSLLLYETNSMVVFLPVSKKELMNSTLANRALDYSKTSSSNITSLLP